MMAELDNTTSAQGLDARESLLNQDLLSDGLSAHDIEGEKFLTFRLKESRYGIDIKSIKEIIEYGGITHIPMTPDCIRGVINLRGNVVPVVDLPVRLERTGGELSNRTCIIIVEMEDKDDEGVTMDVGFVVDAVDEVVGIREEDIESTPAFGAEIRTDFIKGMGKVNNKFVVLLDMATVLSVKELGDLVDAAMD